MYNTDPIATTSAKNTAALRLLVLLGLFVSSFSLALYANLASICSATISSVFGITVQVQRASLSLPMNVALENVVFIDKGGKPPVALGNGTVSLSPLNIFQKKSPVSALTLDTAAIAVIGDNDGTFTIAGGSQAETLLTILDVLQPATARVQTMEVAVDTPMLVHERILKGPLKLLRNEREYSVTASMDERDLLMRLNGALQPHAQTGKIAITLQTRGKRTQIASASTGEMDGAFRYDTSVEIKPGNDSITITCHEATTKLEPFTFTLDCLGSQEILSTGTVLSQHGGTRIESATLTAGDVSFTYSGPMAPSAENPGTITLADVAFSSLLALFDKTFSSPAELEGATISGSFQTRSANLSEVKGNALLTIPPNESNRLPVETVLTGSVESSPNGIVVKNGMISGAGLSNNYRASVDYQTQTISCQLSELFTTTQIANAMFPGKLPDNLEGNLVLTANLSSNLQNITNIKGRVGVELLAREQGKPIYPFEEESGIPLIPLAASGVFDINDNEVLLRKMRLTGQNFSYADFRGDYNRNTGSWMTDFVVAGLNGQATGATGLTGSYVYSDSQEQVSFNLLRENGQSIVCVPQKNNRHSLVWKQGMRKVTVTGEFPFRTIFEGNTIPPMDCSVQGNVDGLKFTACGELSGSPRDFDVTINEGTIEHALLSGSIEKNSRLSLSEKTSEFSTTIHAVNGGTLRTSATFEKEKMIVASAQASDLLLATKEHPAVRITGTAWYKNKGKNANPAGHAALIATPEDPSSALKTATFLGDYKDRTLKITKLRLRASEGHLTVSGNIPITIDASLKPQLRADSVDVLVESNRFNINSLKALSDESAVVTGLINGEMKIEGTTTEPRFQGQFSASKAKVAVSQPQGIISDLSFEASMKGQRLTLNELKGIWNGKTMFSNEMTTFSSISLSPCFSADISSKNTKISQEGIDIKGLAFNGSFCKTEGLKGTVNCQRFAYRTTGSSADTEASLKEYLESARPVLEPSFPLNVTLDIPKAIHLRSSSIDSEFGGKIVIEKPEKGISTCSGTFKLLRGNFYLQGQRFKLHKGHITLRRDPGMMVNGTALPLPLPEMYIKGEGNLSGITVQMSLVGNPLVKNGMHASLDSENTGHSEGELYSLFTEKNSYTQSLGPSILNEISYQLLATPFEDVLGKVLPFDTIRFGTNLTLEDTYSPTILMGKYLGDEFHINLEGGTGSDEDFWKQFAIDFTPEGSNMKLSFARELSGADEGQTTMAFDYSVRF